MSNRPIRQDPQGSHPASNVQSTRPRLRRHMAVAVRWGRPVWRLLVLGYAVHRWYHDESPG